MDKQSVLFSNTQTGRVRNFLWGDLTIIYVSLTLLAILSTENRVPGNMNGADGSVGLTMSRPGAPEAGNTVFNQNIGSSSATLRAA